MTDTQPPARRTRLKNGQTQYLLTHSAQIVKAESPEWTSFLDKLTAKAQALHELADASGLVQLPRSTIIVGDGLYNNVWHPAEEAEKAYKSLDRQPFNLDHSDFVIDEIGFWRDPLYDPATKKLSAIPVVNLNTERGKVALNHIKNRLLADKPAELSSGFWATETTEFIAICNAEEMTARNWDFDHGALVTRGACGPSKGAGIGLSQNSLVTNAEWTSAYINDLPDSSFAYIEPGGSKDDDDKTTPRGLRHFPYKDKDGKIDLPHLRNALARASQSPFGDKALPKLKAAAKEAGIGDYTKDSDSTKLTMLGEETMTEQTMGTNSPPPASAGEAVKLDAAKVREIFKEELDSLKKEKDLQKRQERMDALAKEIEKGNLAGAKQYLDVLGKKTEAPGGKENEELLKRIDKLERDQAVRGSLTRDDLAADAAGKPEGRGSAKLHAAGVKILRQTLASGKFHMAACRDPETGKITKLQKV